jgi:hypothetical protein
MQVKTVAWSTFGIGVASLALSGAVAIAELRPGALAAPSPAEAQECVTAVPVRVEPPAPLPEAASTVAGVSVSAMPSTGSAGLLGPSDSPVELQDCPEVATPAPTPTQAPSSPTASPTPPASEIPLPGGGGGDPSLPGNPIVY